MAMTQGTVVVAADGTVTKSGAAGEIYDTLVADFEAEKSPCLGNDGKMIMMAGIIPGGAEGAGIKRGLARQARAISAIIPYITTNGQAKITTSSAGLQRTPVINTGNTPTQAPTADQFIAIV